MRRLLSRFFPLWALLPLARRLGAVSFQEVAGVGWQCSIRPTHGLESRGRRGVNCWTGQASSLGAALRSALEETGKTADHAGSTFAPKLGGSEFDEG